MRSDTSHCNRDESYARDYARQLVGAKGNSRCSLTPHPQGSTNATGSETTATNWNPSWSWAAGAMISTLEDMHTWASALANGALLSPRMLEQRLQTLGVPGAPPEETYGLGIFNLGGWIGQNGSVPGYQTVAVYLPEEQTTLVILTNTDIPYRGGDPSTPLASAITRVLSPDHVYTLGGAQGPDTPPSPAPTTKPR